MGPLKHHPTSRERRLALIKTLENIRLVNYLKQVVAPRKARGKRFEWWYLLAIICAALSHGAKTPRAIAEWAKLRAKEVNEQLLLPCVTIGLLCSKPGSSSAPPDFDTTLVQN